MIILYNLVVAVYWLLIRFASLFNEKARLFVLGRKNWKKDLGEQINPNNKYIWFHCASLGEFEQGRPVIEVINDKFRDYKVVLTFFSPSGYEVRKNFPGADVVCYLPMDSKKNAITFFDIVKPEKVFFVKYEFWHHFITEARIRQVPLYVLSAIFREGQPFFKSNFVGKWFRKTLNGVNYFFVQNEKSAKLLAQVGFKNVVISGDTRFDRVAAIAATAKKAPIVEKFKDNKPLVIVGSSWRPDEELLARFINQSEGIKFIIVPHEVTISNIKRIEGILEKPFEIYSTLVESTIKNADVLIIDSIGILSSLYQYGDIAYIGGGFGVGIHNILEAATFGLPVLFGPNYKKFNEACELIDIGGAFSISNYEELERNLKAFFENSGKLRDVSGLIKNYINHNVGAAAVIVKNTFNL